MSAVKQTGLPSIFADPNGAQKYELCNDCSKGLQLAIQPQIEAIVHTQFFKKFNVIDTANIRMRFTSRSVTLFNKDSTQKTVEFEDKDKDAKDISLEVLKKANEFWKNCQMGHHYNQAVPAPVKKEIEHPLKNGLSDLQSKELWDLMHKDRRDAIANLEKALQNRGDLYPVNQNPYNVHLNHVELPAKSACTTVSSNQNPYDVHLNHIEMPVRSPASTEATYSLSPSTFGLPLQNGQLFEPEYMKEFRSKKEKGAAKMPRPLIPSIPEKSPAQIELENTYRRITHRYAIA